MYHTFARFTATVNSRVFKAAARAAKMTSLSASLTRSSDCTRNHPVDGTSLHPAQVAQSRMRRSHATPIEKVQVGDLVWAWDMATAAPVKRPVSRLFRHFGIPVLDVVVCGGSGGKQCVTTTIEHPFWVIGSGWVAANELTPGNNLLSLESLPLRVQIVNSGGHRVDVFNFEVDGVHNYFVGSDATLVHNHSRNAGGILDNYLEDVIDSSAKTIQIALSEKFLRSELKDRIDDSMPAVSKALDKVWSLPRIYDFSPEDYQAISWASSPDAALSYGRGVKRLDEKAQWMGFTLMLAYETGDRQIRSSDSRVRMVAEEGLIHVPTYIETLIHRTIGSPYRGVIVLEPKAYLDREFATQLRPGKLILDPYFIGDTHQIDAHLLQGLKFAQIAMSNLSTLSYDALAPEAMKAMARYERGWTKYFDNSYRGSSPDLLNSWMNPLPWEIPRASWRESDMPFSFPGLGGGEMTIDHW